MSLTDARQNMLAKASCEPASSALGEAAPPSEPSGGVSRLLALPYEILVEILCRIERPWSAIRFTNSCRLLRELDADTVWAQWKDHNPSHEALLAVSYFPRLTENEELFGPGERARIRDGAARRCFSCENMLGLSVRVSRLCKQCRESKLRRSLESEGLELRADSGLCTSYIDQCTPPLKEVVETMRKMHITHDHSACNLLIDRAYRGHRGGSSLFVSREGRQRCENKGVDLFQHVLKTYSQVVTQAATCACGQPLVADYIRQNLDHLCVS